MTQVYNYDEHLIKDFIQYISDTHKCAVVQFPDEFAAHQYVNYKFINVPELIQGFIESKDND
jgi:hypothetical protein